MNKRIDFSTMPKVFGMCNIADCPQAETCLRHLAYKAADADRPFIETLNPKWLAKQKGKCRFYLINETVKRPRGFIRTLKALPTGKADSFRLSAMSQMGYRRYYQTRKGEILLTKAEEQLIISLAKHCGVVLDNYFDNYEEVLLWTHE